MENKKWIIEGAYAKPWITQIIKDADRILVLKVKSNVAKKRIFLRYLKGKISKKRKSEKLKNVLELFKFVNNEISNYIFKKIEKLRKKYNKKIIVLKNKKEINEFLKNLK